MPPSPMESHICGILGNKDVVFVEKVNSCSLMLYLLEVQELMSFMLASAASM